MIGGIAGVGSYGVNFAASFYQNRLEERARSAQSAAQAQQGRTLMARRAASPETPVQPVKAVRPVTRDEASLPELTSRLENDPAAMAGRMRMRYGDVGQDGSFVENGNLSPAQGSRLNILEGRLAQAEDALAKNDLKGAENVLTNGLPGQKAEKEIPGMPERETEKEIPGMPGQKAEKDAAVDGGAGQGAESVQEAAEEGECQTCEKRKYQDGSDDMGVSYQTPTNIKPEQAAAAVRGHEMEHVYREQAKAEREGRKVVSQTVTMHTEICPECGTAYVSGGTTRTVTKADTDNSAQQDIAQQDAGRQSAAPQQAVVPGQDTASKQKAVSGQETTRQSAAPQQGADQRNAAGQADAAQQERQKQLLRTPFSAVA